MPCDSHDELRRAATAILEPIDALTQQQIDALKMRDDECLMELDRQIEVDFGAKERTLGALGQHRDEHGC